MRDAAINLRALPEQRDLIDRAANLLGKDRSDMNSPAAKRMALSRGFRGSRTWTCHVAVAEVWVSPPRPFQACLRR
ncbi:DUF1778 domain-containing protein [Thiomonas sp. FB-Cd]|uniref:type II toxin -antitoxin system TacA 1-like antitoxin n=1 Tax=Thiomonas sp. FB-Cd TaxID=1158292 RepID=UPI000A94482F|nr:DUF1778 domain-containing protein [Thiomonas sp. FB-Cd]